MTTPPTPASRPQRPSRPVVELTVQSRVQLTAQMVRLTLGGPGFDAFVDNGKTDKYVKIQFPEHDVTRTYTVHSVDADARTLSIDFVVHGDEGIAGPWAAAAQPGDTVALRGPGGDYSPDTGADWHLFAGDASALPAISAALVALPSTARGVAHLLVEDESEILDVAKPEGVALHWHVHSPSGSDPAVLAEAIAAGAWPDGRVQVFAHGERESMKAIRALLKERGVPREDLSLSGYWAHGRTEDRFQAEKREPIGKIPD